MEQQDFLAESQHAQCVCTVFGWQLAEAGVPATRQHINAMETSRRNIILAGW